jgi:hypothetical protein
MLKQMPKVVVVVLFGLVSSYTITMAFDSQVIVASSSGKSIVGNYADGYEAGKAQGRDDNRNGIAHNSKCPPNDSLSWCAGYKIGYSAGWFASETLGGK